MADNSENIDNPIPLSPADNGTDTNMGTVDATNDFKNDDGSILNCILEELAKSQSGKDDAESLRGWIDNSKLTGQGLDMKDDDGQTPLHVAVGRGLLEAVRKFINGKADLNIQDDNKHTPLFQACLTGHKEIVRLLLENGANTILADDDNRTPLYVAAEIGDKYIAELLLDKSKETLNFKSTKPYEWTPLHVAASEGHGAIISYLRDRGAELDVRDEDGWTPLRTAVNFSEEGAIQALLEKNKDRKDEDLQLETEDSEGYTSLMAAAESGFLEGARLLVEAGAKCDKSKASKSADTNSTPVITPENTALHLAVSANKIEMVRFLLKSGADLNARNATGQHSSHLASLQGNEAILKLLLDAKNSKGLNARDDDDMTPLHFASSAGEPNRDERELSDLAAKGQTDDEISTSQPGRYIQVVRLLLLRNADTEAVTKDDKTALELAFKYLHSERGEAILDSLKETSPQFSRALFWAASNSKTHAVAISLLKRQLEGQLKKSRLRMPSESKDWTAIEWAAYTKSPNALLLLIASSPQSEKTNGALKRAKELLQSRDQQTETTSKPKSRQHDGADDTKKPVRAYVEGDMIRDIINNPPTGSMYSGSQEYTIPSLEENSSLGKYQAAIVQFREQQGRFGSILQSQSVKKTIYTEGPRKIMDVAVSKLEEQAKKLAEWQRKYGRPNPDLHFNGSKRTKFTWVHLPALNMAWMDDLLQRIMKDEGKTASEFNQARSFFKDSWIQVPDKVSQSRIMRPRFVWRDANGNGTLNEYPSKPKDGELSQNDNQNKNGAAVSALAVPPRTATAVYMPYLSYSFECYEDAKMREFLDSQNQLISRPSKASEPSPRTLTAEKDGSTKSEHEKKLEYAKDLLERRRNYRELMEEYEDKIVHGSSTLDESYYHFADNDADSQDDKKRRNKSQVVTGSWHDSRSKNQGLPPYWPLIRVNQLWIWTINEEWLISASSHPIDESENEILHGILNVLERQVEAGVSDLQPSSASEMSQFIVDYCVESYERKPKGVNADRPKDCKLENFLSIRQEFSKSINSIARKEAELFETVTALTDKMRTVSSLNEQSKDAWGLSLNEQLKDAAVRAEKLSKTVKHILDELNMLEATAYYQQDVQKSMKAMKAMKAVKKQGLQTTMKEMKKDKITETDLAATYVISDIKRLDSVANRVLSAVNTTLSLQQSEVANLQARLSMQQGRVLMVFTVVTIVFLPLSFLTSFFALNVSSFQPQPWAVGVIFSVSIAFSIPTVILAFTWEQSKKFMHKQLDWIFYQKQTGNAGSKPDLKGSGACLLGADQGRNHLLGPHQTGNRGQSISQGTELDLEMGHGVNDSSAQEQKGCNPVNGQAA